MGVIYSNGRICYKHSVATVAYFVTAVSYGCNLLVTSTLSANRIKHFTNITVRSIPVTEEKVYTPNHTYTLLSIYLSICLSACLSV